VSRQKLLQELEDQKKSKSVRKNQHMYALVVAEAERTRAEAAEEEAALVALLAAEADLKAREAGKEAECLDGMRWKVRRVSEPFFSSCARALPRYSTAPILIPLSLTLLSLCVRI
jgi:hypothetical protein